MGIFDWLGTRKPHPDDTDAPARIGAGPFSEDVVPLDGENPGATETPDGANDSYENFLARREQAETDFYGGDK